MDKVNIKEYAKFDDSLEKAMEVIARNWKKVVDGNEYTQFNMVIIRDKKDDNDLDNINCHKWYVSVSGSVGDNNGGNRILAKTFYMDLED